MPWIVIQCYQACLTVPGYRYGWQNWMPHQVRHSRLKSCLEKLKCFYREYGQPWFLYITHISLLLELFYLYKNSMHWLHRCPASFWGIRWHSWLRHYAASRKVAGSITDGAKGIIQRLNVCGLTMAPGLTQSLKEMSTRNISWEVKAVGA
jgi:hypothetical protein